MLDGPRWGPKQGRAEQLVVLCHGVGADGHDLIDLAPWWAAALPQAAFVAPDAPEPYDGAPMGRQWFPLWDRTPAQLAAGADAAARAARRLRRCRTGAARPARRRLRADGLQPGRDDGAACRPAPGGAAARHPGLFRRPARPRAAGGDVAAPAGPAGARRGRRGGAAGPLARGGAGAARGRLCGREPVLARVSATASTRPACPPARLFLQRAFAGMAA